MFALSFLAVFREGAETILFYVGIIPRITTAHFILGIGLAIAVLIIIAVAMTKASQAIQPHRIFFHSDVVDLRLGLQDAWCQHPRPSVDQYLT